MRYLKRRHLIPHRTLTSNVVNTGNGEWSGATQRYGSHFSCNLVSGNGTTSDGYREAPLSPNNNVRFTEISKIVRFLKLFEIL